MACVGDLDVISFEGSNDRGTRAIVYENVGTKYHPEMFEVETHAITDLYAAVCQNLGFECTLTVHDYDRDGECVSPYRQALRYQKKMNHKTEEGGSDVSARLAII